MNTVVYSVMPSPKSRNANKGLGLLSAGFAILLLMFILWAAFTSMVGTWTIVILCLPMALFMAIAWFVLRFAGDYVSGILVFPEGISRYYPMRKEEFRQEEYTPFSAITLLEFEETLELHRVGRKVKRFNVYRIRIQTTQQETLRPYSEMLDLLPEQVIKFRQLPDFLLQHKLLDEERIDVNKMPRV